MPVDEAARKCISGTSSCNNLQKSPNVLYHWESCKNYHVSSFGSFFIQEL